MHYAILNSEGNALGWFTDEGEARRALAGMLSEPQTGADLDLVAFEGSGRPKEPVLASARSAWPAVRLVWSSQDDRRMPNSGNLVGRDAVVLTSADVFWGGLETATDHRVPIERKPVPPVQA